jgi:hypothetical protein
VVNVTPRPLYPMERPVTLCTEGWVGPRASLDVCEKSRPHRDSIPVGRCQYSRLYCIWGRAVKSEWERMWKEAIEVELKVLSRNLSGGSEEDHEKNDNRCRPRIEQGPCGIRARSVRPGLAAFSLCQ